MNRLILGSVMALILMDRPAAAECTYYGVLYSEGARVCMHRTMFMCRGQRWVRTAERCWERYSHQTILLQRTGQERKRRSDYYACHSLPVLDHQPVIGPAEGTEAGLY